MIRTSKTENNFHSGTVKKSIIITASDTSVWKIIRNIGGLSMWVTNVESTDILSGIKHGIGAIRKITFKDGNIVEEHVVGWKDRKYFSYIAVSGLPLRGYHATISIKPHSKKSTKVTWESYFNSKKMTKKEFSEFLLFISAFYSNSLKNLKKKLER